ncbi:MAG: hypothetical protein JW947_06335 [Sedimentisphaerales bacterium]|nr:hypothetical protein [Sedimentisphaerales bacterium]
MMKNLIYGIAVIVAAATCMAPAAPEPAIIQAPNEWTLNVRFEHPQQIALRASGEKKPKRYWYTIITLTNKTSRDVDFHPKFELMTDTFEITPAGKGLPAVFEQIRRRHRRKYPLLESLEDAGNKILQGEDNAKDIAIIWPDFDLKAKSIKIYIAGLSNEAAAIDHPTEKDETGKPVKIYLRKTLELSYKLGGDATFRSGAKPVYEGQRWVMR